MDPSDCCLMTISATFRYVHSMRDSVTRTVPETLRRHADTAGHASAEYTSSTGKVSRVGQSSALTSLPTRTWRPVTAASLLLRARLPYLTSLNTHAGLKP